MLSDDPPTPNTIKPSQAFPIFTDLPKVEPTASTNSTSRINATREEDERVLERAERQVSEANHHPHHRTSTSKAHHDSDRIHSLARQRSSFTHATATSVLEIGSDHSSDINSIKEGHRLRRRQRHTFEGSDVFDRQSTSSTRPPHRRKDDKINSLGRLLVTVHGSNVLVRHLTYIIPVALVLLIPILIGALSDKSASVGGVSLLWFSIWLMIVWLTLWAARLISAFIPSLIVIISTTFTNNRKKWRNLGYQIVMAATLFLWWLAIEISFLPTMTNHHVNGDNSVRPWERTMNKLLLSLMIGTLLNFIEKIAMQLVAMRFHLRTYQDRIELNKVQITTLTRLYIRSKELLTIGDGEFVSHHFSCVSSSTQLGQPEDAPPPKPESEKGDSKKGGKSENITGPDISTTDPATTKHAFPPDPNSDGARTPGRIVKDAQQALNQIGNQIGDVAENMARRVAKDFSGSKESIKNDRNVVTTLLLSAESSLSLARQLFRAYADKETDIILPHAFQPVFDDDDEADSAFLIFDKDMNGDISMAELEAVCVEIGLERKAITDSLKDLDSVISKLDKVFVFIVVVITILIFVSLISSGAATAITSAGSTILALSWLFSATAQEFLQSIIFVFVKHPFDVGDRVRVYGNTGLDGKGDDYYVKKISLLYTEFKKLEGHIVQAPNSYLNTLFILNQRRSGGLAEAVQIVIKFGTTLDQIEDLRERLVAFVKEEKREYQGKILTELKAVEEAHSLSLNVVFFYKSNWQNELLRLYRRNKFICKLMVTMQELCIEGPRMRLPGQKQTFPLYIQQAFHSLPPPQAGNWGTPDQPRGYVAADPEAQGDNGEDNIDLVPVQDPPSQTDVDVNAEGSENNSKSGFKWGRKSKNGKNQKLSHQGVTGRHRADTSASTASRQQDYSLGMEGMASEHWPGALYEDQHDERVRKIMSGMTRARNGSTSTGPMAPSRANRNHLHHLRDMIRTHSTHESIDHRHDRDNNMTAAHFSRSGEGDDGVEPLPFSTGELKRSTTDVQSRWRFRSRLMSLRRGNSSSSSSIGPRHRPSDVEEGMPRIPESRVVSRRSSGNPMNQFQQIPPPNVSSTGVVTNGPGVDGSAIELSERTIAGGDGAGDVPDAKAAAAVALMQDGVIQSGSFEESPHVPPSRSTNLT